MIHQMLNEGGVLAVVNGKKYWFSLNGGSIDDMLGDKFNDAAKRRSTKFYYFGTYRKKYIELFSLNSSAREYAIKEHKIGCEINLINNLELRAREMENYVPILYYVKKSDLVINDSNEKEIISGLETTI